MGQAAKKIGNGSKVNALGGFYPDKVEGKVMRAFVKEQKIKLAGVDADTTDEQLALSLTMHFRESLAEDDMCKCERCGGEGPDDLEACPFCGLESATDDEEADEADEADDEEADAPEPEPSASNVVDVSTAKAKKAAAAKKDPAHKATSTALAKAEPTTMATKATEKDLDDAVEEVVQLKTNAAESYWELGKKVREINKRGLWKLRKTEDGKVRYSSFEAFCHHELHMTSGNAYQLMAAAGEFTKDDIQAMGHSKAALILKAAPEDRKALAEAAKKGASARTIREGVNKSKKERGYEGATEAAKRGSKGAVKTSAASAVKQDKITIAKIEGTHVVKLYAKPASMKNLDLDACKRAKGIKDVPFGRMELANGVVMYVSIQVGRDGFLQAKMDTRRESTV